MSLLTISSLSKFYGPDEIFSGITAEIPQRARIALVGPNGAGKTTLINILVGLDLPTEGSVHSARGLRIGFLPQRPELAGLHTLWEEQLRAFNHLREMETQLARLEQEMTDPRHYDKALEAYGSLQAEFERLGGYEYETQVRMVLTGVGFDPEDYQMPLPQLSGGQRTRALLARLLLEAPDLLILDEPTNHLDIQAVEWLENHLKDFSGAVLAVSHDRYFIDHFASSVWELEFGRLEVYRGNYSHYSLQRQERRERLLKEYEAQQEFISKELEYIRKHMGSRWTAQAKGRQKKLETMKKRGKIIEGPPRNHRQMALRMQAATRSGDRVLVTRGLAVGYADDPDGPLLQVPDILLLRGETAALIGPNGVGKTTFLKTITGQLSALAGEVRPGANVRIGYFAQAHEGLDPDKTVLDEITAVKPMPVSEARNYLGRFMFSGDDVFRTVRTLSGGERGRLALAQLALSGANLLLLDEPSNHLDIDSQEILEEVLDAYEGTILLVSHDRYLIAALATQIWEATPGQLNVFEGSYAEWVEARNRRLEGVRADTDDGQRSRAANYTEKKHGMNPRELEKRVQELEAEIEKLEAMLHDLTESISRASVSGSPQQVQELGERYTQAEDELQSAIDEWSRLME